MRQCRTVPGNDRGYSRIFKRLKDAISGGRGISLTVMDDAVVQRHDEHERSGSDSDRRVFDGEKEAQTLNERNAGKRNEETQNTANSLSGQRYRIEQIIEIVEILQKAFHRSVRFLRSYLTIVRAGDECLGSGDMESPSCNAAEFDCFACAIAR